MAARTTGFQTSPGPILAAIFLPPLAVFLTEGVARNFWICFGLTCLGFLPGMAFALYLLLGRWRGPPAPA